MLPKEFSSTRFCLRALLWSGLLFGSRCDDNSIEGDRTEMGMVGSPVEYSTITITTTIAYKPTLAPGDSTYSLFGCYGWDSKGGHLLGQDEGYAIPIVPPGKMTVDACLEGCATLKPSLESSDHYEYAGLMNGDECFCGSQLDPRAPKVSPEECQVPCSGDAGVLCGGSDTIAVYSRKAASDNKSAASTDKNALESSGTKSNPSSTLEGVVFRTGGRAGTTKETDAGSSPSTETPTLSPDQSKTATTTSTIAAVTGSLSGAIILSALSILCFRAYKRKKQQQQAQDTNLVKVSAAKRSSRRPIPSAIDTKPRREPEDDDGDSAINLGVTTDSRDMIPTTPALESGGHMQHSSGLHARLRSPRSAAADRDRDTLYDALLGQVTAGPAPPKPPLPPPGGPSSSAASSAVQWRGAPRTPTSASTALFDFGFDGAGARNSGAGAGSKVTSPAATARSEASLGTRAWHRRKLSTTFQPPASGPPSVPLPPTPPFSKMYGMDRGANASARSLGAESIPPPTPPLKDSPTLPRKMQPGPQSLEEGGEERGGDEEGRSELLEDAEPTIPVLRPGEEFVAKPRRATMYAPPRDESDDEKSEASTALSATTVATSVLFTAPLDDDDDDNRMWSGA
ncbi:hypothetical protein GGR53DRAFT_63915 [Hypoxylon sp. FL1150]|nr:hypothetical protein GGR53DRAFT_63915 [Hypoxylon sp. FL1150]